MKIGWKVRSRFVWKGIPRHGEFVPTGMSHHFDGDLATCGIFAGMVKFGERKVKSMTGKKPVRCKNCERALTARKKRLNLGR